MGTFMTYQRTMPITREECIYALLQALFERDPPPSYITQLLEHYHALPPHDNPHVSDARGARLAMELILTGVELLKSSIVARELKQFVRSFFDAIAEGDTDEIEENSAYIRRGLLMFEAAVTDNQKLWRSQFNSEDVANSELKRMDELKKRLEMTRPHHD